MNYRMFSAQHEELAGLARAILARVTSMTEASTRDDGLDPLPSLRLRLARMVSAHCAAEIDELNAHLALHPRVARDHAGLVRRYHDELLAWRGELMQCNAGWSARRVNDCPAAFAVAFTPIAEALHARLEWEEQEFYPAVFGRSASRMRG